MAIWSSLMERGTKNCPRFGENWARLSLQVTPLPSLWCLAAHPGPLEAGPEDPKVFSIQYP